MPADHPYLLVVDPDPESAARVNSLLRDAGLSVNVLHADNAPEARRLTADFSPFLLYYPPSARAAFPVEEAAKIAEDHQTFLGVPLENDAQELFEEASASTACIGLQSEARLPAIARRLAGLGEAERAQTHSLEQEQELERRLDLLMNSTSEPIAYVHEGLHVAANQAYLDLLGLASFDDLAMVSLLEILEREGTDLKAMVRAFGRGEFPGDGEAFGLRRPDGENMAVELSFAPVRYEGEDCIQMLVRTEADVRPDGAESPPDPAPEPAPPPEDDRLSAAPATPEAPGDAADHPPAASEHPALDTLTGMYRRASFLQRLNERLARLPDSGRAAVFFLTNDGATEQLDELNMADMDAYVLSTANEVLACLEDDDDVCRVSDAAFVVYALRQDKGELQRLGEKLRAGIERQGQDRPGEAVPASCSVGLVLLDHQDHESGHTVEKARAACRLAGEEGNRVIRYKPARLAGVSEDEEALWRERLRYALQNEDFYTVQHAIMNLEGDLEGLVENRSWMHEDDADVPAKSYLPAAERNQLASQVDRLVIPGLLRAVLNSDDRQIIEISGNSLQDFSFPAWFQRTLQETRFPGQRIVLQWPAWAARQQTKAARRLIEELAPLGVKFSVSGFDHEPKTLELLQVLKIQFLTLDRELTSDLAGDPTRLDAVREVIQAAQDVQTLTIASNVSTSEDLAMLWRGGVKLVSGDFIQETPRVIGQ